MFLNCRNRLSKKYNFPSLIETTGSILGIISLHVWHKCPSICMLGFRQIPQTCGLKQISFNSPIEKTLVIFSASVLFVVARRPSRSFIKKV